MVKWTKPAKEQLRRVHDFIAADSRVYAKKVAKEITAKSEMLNDFPRLGRTVPELHDENIRELLVYSYRVIYGIVDDEVLILALLHTKQDISEGLP